MAYSSVSPLTVFGSMVASICPSANNSNTVWSRIFVRGRRPKDPRITRQGSARNGKHCSRHPWMILPSTRVGEAEPMCWKTGISSGIPRHAYNVRARIRHVPPSAKQSTRMNGGTDERNIQSNRRSFVHLINSWSIVSVVLLHSVCDFGRSLC